MKNSLLGTFVALGALTFGIAFLSDVKVEQNIASQNVSTNTELTPVPLASTSIQNLTYSFGGQKAEAGWGVVIVQGYRLYKNWDDRNVKYAFPNSARIEWNEASDICNRSNGRLIWKNGLKSCMNK